MRIISGERYKEMTKTTEAKDKKIQELEARLEEAKKAILDLVKENLVKEFPEYHDLLSNDEINKEIWERKLKLRSLPEQMLEQKPTNDAIITFTLDHDWIGGGGQEEHFRILFLDASGKLKTEHVSPCEFIEERSDVSDKAIKERYLKNEGESIADALKRVDQPSLVVCEKRDDVSYGFVFIDHSKTTTEGYLHPGFKKDDKK